MLAGSGLPRLFVLRRPNRPPSPSTRSQYLICLGVSRAAGNIQRYKKRMGWSVPWFSSSDSDFNVDFGLTTDAGETFGLSVFLREGDRVFRTYFTAGRGVEALGSTWTFLDLTPFGRQEDWEDSPVGSPQSPPYVWWRRHDEYRESAS
jgi:predicted dithiol-disulfide oxidoreductase (DUF899 family)